MTASYRAFLTLLCASAGCFSGPPDDGDRPPAPFSEQFGGPTSDWPESNHGGKPPASGSASDKEDEDDDETDSVEDKEPVSPGDNGGNATSGRDAGKGAPKPGGSGSAPTPTMDAGVASPSTGASRDGGTTTAPPSTGGPRPADAGNVEPADGGASEGGVGGMCTNDSDRRSSGACFGVYCAMTPAELAAQSEPEGACASDRELMLACDGELSRVVEQCAEDNVLTLGQGRSVARCAARAPALSEVSASCVDCYVEEVLCAASQCLTACLSSGSRSCSECRLSRCGEDFRACSGLPAPSTR